MPDPRLLGPPDSGYFEKALGYLSSDEPSRAQLELDKIRVEFQSHPYVRELRWNAHAMADEWEAALVQGSKLVEVDPEDPVSWLARSQALHRLSRTPEAWDSLLPALERFPQHQLIWYNLACYASVMGNRDEAWGRLEKALMYGEADQIKQMALEDPDLEALWARIREGN